MDISLTRNSYSHVLLSMQANAAEKMDDLLGHSMDVSKEFSKLAEQKSTYEV